MATYSNQALTCCIYCVVVILMLYMIYHFQNIQREAYLEFIHIPKTGGTTIENVAKENGVHWGRFKHNKLQDARLDPPPKQVCTDTPYIWHVAPRHLNADNPYSKHDTFCVIRDPLERMVSEYNWLWDSKHKNNKTTVDENEYFTANKLNDWIKYHIDHQSHLTGGEGCHHQPQYNYVYDDNGNITCDYPLDFANLTQSFNALMDKHNELKSIKMLPTRRDNQSNHRLSVKDISNENLVKLKRIYQKDIELYDRIHEQHTSAL